MAASGLAFHNTADDGNERTEKFGESRATKYHIKEVKKEKLHSETKKTRSLTVTSLQQCQSYV